MKGILKSFVINIFVLWAVQQFILGFKINGGLLNLILIAGALTAINIFGKPLLKILFIPINLVTMGLFFWVINVIILYILVYFFPEIKIAPWDFKGISYNGFLMPKIHFGIIETYIAGSFSISILSSFLKWL